MGFPGSTSGKEPTCQCRRYQFDTWVGKIPWRRACNPAPVFFPGEFRGQRSLEGYSPWVHIESDMTGQITFSLSYLSSFIVLHVNIKLSEYHLLKRLYFLHQMILASLLEINLPRIYMIISDFWTLFYWSLCVSLDTDFITVAL